MSTKQKDDPAAAGWLGDHDGPRSDDRLYEALDSLYGEGPGGNATTTALRHLKDSVERLQANTLYYDAIPDTLLGTVYLAVGPEGLVALNFSLPEARFLEKTGQLAGLESPVFVRDPRRTAMYRQQVLRYLAGETDDFDLPVDLRTQTAFQQAVLEATARVPRGQIATYGEIARRIGRPAAARAVGQALANNPVPLVIPCHRVVASDGSLRGYSGGGGVKTKAHLLAMEGAAV